ncbi:MAG: S41 family peptidase [Saprospiraceae bacterium]
MPENLKSGKIRVYEPLLVALAAAIGLIAGYNMDFNNNDYSLIRIDYKPQTLINRDGRIEEILRFVETNYVDSLDQDLIAIDAIRHILRQLDPHSSYITSDELVDHNEKMEGRYNGIGIETIELNDTFYIMRVIEDSPADLAGIRIGDAIITMNGDTVVGDRSSYTKVRNYFRDLDASALHMQLISLAESEVHELSIEPDEIEVASADISFALDEEIGYIKLSRFSANTYEQFMRSVESMAVENQTLNLVIDLRDNPGGYLPEAVKILSQLFKEKNKLLCYTEGLNRKRSEYHSTGKNFYDIGKIVVLINEYSASGSEILAGAIQDWDRGVIIGQPSFGKGLVQEIFPLRNGGALRLTVAKYYTPSGRLIQKSYDNINQNFEADTNAFKTMLLERNVAGGGGIVPDIFIEDPYNDFCYNYSEYIDYYLLHKMKETGSSKLEPQLLNSKDLNDFVADYFEEDAGVLEMHCKIDLDEYIRARYQRLTEGPLAYQKYLADSDPYIARSIDFIENKKTTLALLTMED